MQIETIATIGKGLRIVREKDAEGGEVTRAHLAFDELIITRESFDEIAGMTPGWSRAALFDECGAPLAFMRVEMPTLSRIITGTVGDPEKPDRLPLIEAELSSLVFTPRDSVVSVSGKLTWVVAGDEAADCEPLIGRVCAIKWQVRAMQGDMLRPGAKPPGNGKPALQHQAAEAA
jgi:hypothetical protein